MVEAFRVTEGNLRELAERTVGDPLPESVRGVADKAVPEGEQPEFYAGFVSGLNCGIHMLASLGEAGVIKAVGIHLAIRAARLYFGTDAADGGVDDDDEE